MKIILLYIIKFLGGFWLASFLVRKKTLVLAYHSFETVDETSFRPKLFIKKPTFERRLRYLENHSTIIKLDDLFNKNKPNNSVVITIDDGWASTLTLAAPSLNYFDFPYTIYLTTESVIAEQPIFHILLDYILRNSIGKDLRLENTSIKSVVTLNNLPELTQKIEQIKSTKYDTGLLRKIARVLEFDLDEVIQKKSFTLLSIKEVQEIASLGADIQLHTHTHHTHLDDELAFKDEISVNQSYIENITGIIPTHHCYPSGSFNHNSSLYLQSLGVDTATTCLPGFCDAKSNVYEIPRFLDGENIPQIVFEAEVSGVMELLRKLK